MGRVMVRIMITVMHRVMGRIRIHDRLRLRVMFHDRPRGICLRIAARILALERS